MATFRGDATIRQNTSNYGFIWSCFPGEPTSSIRRARHDAKKRQKQYPDRYAMVFAMTEHGWEPIETYPPKTKK